MYVEMTFFSSNDLPNILVLIQFFSLKICSIFLSSSRETSTPSNATGLIPLYFAGLCDAVIINPPSYPNFFVAYSKQGVGTSPAI